MENNISQKLYVALLHNPVYNKRHEVVTSALTNIDVHDISRASKTYGCQGFFIVHPEPSQQELAKRILGHWQEGHGSVSNPKRQAALFLAQVVDSLEHAAQQVEEQTGEKPLVVVTKAQPQEGDTEFAHFVQTMQGNTRPIILVFGTAWGLVQELVDAADYKLAPIRPYSSYRHLSVRSAVSICLDRLIGDNG